MAWLDEFGRRMFCASFSAMLLLTAWCAGAAPAGADDIRVFSGGAPQQALRAMTPEFERASGHRVHFTFALVTEVQHKIAAGEKPDLILLPVPLLGAVDKTLPLRSDTRLVLARVGIAVVMPEGATAADISTPDSFRKALLDARAVAVPEPTTPGGAHVARMMGQLGIADEMKPKLLVKAAIHGGAELVTKGEANLGLYLASEVQNAKGAKIVGMLPGALQYYVVYGSAIPVSNVSPTAAADFVKFVSDPIRADVWKRSGFEHVAGGR